MTGPSTAYRWGILLLIGLIGFATLVILSYGLDNLATIQTFDTDEFRIAELAQTHLAERSLDPHGFYYYGHLYDSVGYWLLRTCQWLEWQVDARMIGMTFRLLSLGFGVLTAVAMYALARVVALPRELALVSAALMFTMPDYVFYMRTIHPDTLQAFLMIAGMAFALRAPTFGNALVSAVFAGLAFSTKYNGIFLLPFCFLPYAMARFADDGFGWRQLPDLIGKGAAVVAVFSVMYVVTNPYGAAHFRSVISTIRWLSNYTATGHGKIEPADPALWLPPLAREFREIGLVAFAGGMIVTCAQLLRAGWGFDWRRIAHDDNLRAKFLLLLYVLIVGGQLLGVRIREARYTYHLFPMVITLSLLAYWDLVRRARIPGGIRTVVLNGASVLLALFLVSQTYHDLSAMASVSLKPKSEALTVGNFIAENFPASTRVLADAYSYIPPKFSAVYVTYGVDLEEMGKFKPDVLVFNRPASGRWIWKKAGTKVAEQNWVRDPSYPAADIKRVEDTLTALLSPSSDWKVVHETGDFVVFGRK